MYYIIVTEMELTGGSTSCKIQGLSLLDLIIMEDQLKSLNMTYVKQDKFHEIDTQGVVLLNLLAGSKSGFRVCNQSMVIEKSNMGGRTTQIQKIVWLLNKE